MEMDVVFMEDIAKGREVDDKEKPPPVVMGNEWDEGLELDELSAA